MKVGLISDTHDLLRDEVFEAFAGVERILHAGDVGDGDILHELATVAPVAAVWGNTDGSELRESLSEVFRQELAGFSVVLVHGHQFGSPTPERVAGRYPDADLVVFGHSHQPIIQTIGSVLTVNPGSAGPRRFRDPVTVAVVTLQPGKRPEAHVVDLLKATDRPT
jgi:putative phosphoesterase